MLNQPPKPETDFVRPGCRLASILVFISVVGLTLASILTDYWMQYRVSVSGLEPISGTRVTLGISVHVGVTGTIYTKVSASDSFFFGGGEKC